MAQDSTRRSISPPGSSGRDSPVLRPSRRILEEEPRRGDKSYRRYAAGIERALSSFETARQEWADYISFLGRLLKAIQAHPAAVDTLPHKTLVANRLAQCLSPSLPSGVQQKAVEVYSFIFSLIGKEALAQDLPVYLPGISAVLSFASLSLRPSVLSLFETHILNLDATALHPALRALLLCLLPAIEEETSEEFDRALSVIDTVHEIIRDDAPANDGLGHAVGDAYFWQSFFLASINSRSRRQGALVFLARRLPKLISQDAALTEVRGNAESESEVTLPRPAQALVIPEPGLLIRSMIAGLEDEQVLLQRGFLDLLLSHLPLHSPVLVNLANDKDVERLVGAATGVVSRRDMSLNRRLWSWLTGPSDYAGGRTDNGSISTANDTSLNGMAERYFTRYGLKPLKSYLQRLISGPERTPSEAAKPFRICLSLMDKQEIGGTVVQVLFIPAMRKVFEYKQNNSDASFQEVLKSAGSFFDGVESGIIWGQIGGLIASSLSQGQANGLKAEENLELVGFILDEFNVREEEMISFHIPLVALLLVTLLDGRAKDQVLDDSPLTGALRLFDKLISLMPERARLNDSFGDSALAPESDEIKLPSHQSIIEQIHTFYTEHRGNLSQSPPPLSSRATANLLLSQTFSHLMATLESGQESPATSTRARLMSVLMAKLPDLSSMDSDKMIEAFSELFSRSSQGRSRATISFPLLQGITQIMTQWVSVTRGTRTNLSQDVASLLSNLIEAIWLHLSPSCPKYHVEAVRCLWQLDELTLQDRILEASVSRFVAIGTHDQRASDSGVDNARRFAIMWTHTAHMSKSHRRITTRARRDSNASSILRTVDGTDRQSALHRPLLLLLDSLSDESTALQHFVVGWLESLTNLGTVLEAVLGRVIRSHATSTPETGRAAGEGLNAQLLHRDESAECLYFLQHLSNLLKLPSENVWIALSKPAEIVSTRPSSSEDDEQSTLMVLIIQTCLEIVRSRAALGDKMGTSRHGTSLQRMCLSIILHIMQSPKASTLSHMNLDEVFVGLLKSSLSASVMDASVRTGLLDVVLASIRLNSKSTQPKRAIGGHARSYSTEAVKRTISYGGSDNGPSSSLHVDTQLKHPPAQLLKCVQEGISSNLSHDMLDSWINFLIEVLPLFADSLFQNLIPLVECFCHQIQHHFRLLVASFGNTGSTSTTAPEPAMVALLSGLEHILAAAHERLQVEESKAAAARTPETTQGFFGNAVSGMFAGETQKGRSATANTRLTVLLCFQDAVRMCLSIWSWGYGRQEEDHDPTSAASFNYVSVRLRNKSRRILDRMFGVEALECLETLIVAWVHQAPFTKGPGAPPVVSLLHVLESCKPKVAMPAIFNSIYSRTSPSALEPSRTSSLTSDITDIELGFFLVQYTESVDADAMDEIWTDCMTFLKDVLANPLPHNSILPSLLGFLLTLSEKVGNTNFGEQRRMRKELSDTFMRLLTATFTTRTGSSYHEPALDSTQATNGDTEKGSITNQKSKPLDLVDNLASMVPRLSGILQEQERVTTAATSISTHIISPLVQSKHFPDNVRQSHLDLLQTISKLPAGSKVWRKDVSEAFNHSRFFSSNLSLIRDGWIPILQQWVLAEKDRILPELIIRVPAPASAGTLFGVGATNARLEGDKRAQMNLRRISMIILAMAPDFAVPNLGILEEKLVELLNATGASSPSSFTRADTFMLLRAIVIKSSPIHLAPLWPLISSELNKALSAVSSSSPDYDTYNAFSLLQACKLLDLLLAVAPDDFQMHEWIFITDSIDAVYRPEAWQPVALADDIAEELAAVAGDETSLASLSRTGTASTITSRSHVPTQPKIVDAPLTRKPLLVTPDTAADVGKEKFIRSTLRQFLSQLSLHTFESAYSMQRLDVESWEDLLLRDLFCEGSLIGARA